ncbi:F0F1 ATP synthase subunit delta [Nitrosophilus kaiyonis]|uniref:F0F1 ATP synthase subunit delta n=1 Tax=Nitrosophilus kaiyonis TaxID=2930200 RepID=UPI00249304EF|nr:F0F1 ATP synthase subunit delta [Nitrosophilus kaiyonis]
MFNWWTFAFSIINFLVVIYILYKVLFKPIKRVIQEREEIINKRFKIATEKEKEALDLKNEYEKELKNIKILKQKIVNEANAEALKVREKIIEDAKREAKEILEKEKAIIEEEKQKIYKYILDKSKEFSKEFAKEFFVHIIDKDINELLIEKFIKNFEKDFKEKLEKIEPQESCKISITLFDIIDERIMKDIDYLISKYFKCQNVQKEIKIDKNLIGGIKLRVNAYLFDGSIKAQIDEIENLIEHQK